MVLSRLQKKAIKKNPASEAKILAANKRQQSSSSFKGGDVKIVPNKSSSSRDKELTSASQQLQSKAPTQFEQLATAPQQSQQLSQFEQLATSEENQSLENQSLFQDEQKNTLEVRGQALADAAKANIDFAIEHPFQTAGYAATVIPVSSLETLLAKSIAKGVTSTVVNNGIKIAINSKIVKNTGKILSSKFTKGALLAAGGWASAVFLGLWGQAEAPEPMNIVDNKFLIPEAMRTGNWTAVNEAIEISKEINDLPWWQDILKWSPLSPLIGIPKKISGSIDAITTIEKFRDDQIIKFENGETEAQYWEQRDAEKAAQYKANVNYYNEQALILQQNKIAAENEDRNADAIFWAGERAKQRDKEAKDRIAIAKFWEDYRKTAYKVQEDNRPSNLKFGLL